MTRLAALVLCCAVWGASQEAPPYKATPGSPAIFEGPERDAPEPRDIREVVIGYYGPSEDAHPEGGILWQGATLAIEEVNRAGGYKGKPFRLAARWSENPWRGGAALITRMAFEDRVWAIIGSIEGAGTHLAEQVVAKALLTLVNPVATDRSVHGAGVPWMFSIVQGDDQHAAALARALAGRTIVTLKSTDHDSRAFAAFLKTACSSANVRTRLEVEFEAAKPDLHDAARNAVAEPPMPSWSWPAPRDSARAVKALRAAGYRGLIAGGPWFGRAVFAAEAGEAAEGALFPLVGGTFCRICAHVQRAFPSRARLRRRVRVRFRARRRRGPAKSRTQPFEDPRCDGRHGALQRRERPYRVGPDRTEPAPAGAREDRTRQTRASRERPLGGLRKSAFASTAARRILPGRTGWRRSGPPSTRSSPRWAGPSAPSASQTKMAIAPAATRSSHQRRAGLRSASGSSPRMDGLDDAPDRGRSGRTRDPSPCLHEACSAPEASAELMAAAPTIMTSEPAITSAFAVTL